VEKQNLLIEESLVLVETVAMTEEVAVVAVTTDVDQETVEHN
jgi:hypothetical protein